MSKFASDLAEAVRVNLKDLLRFPNIGGKILWVKASASTGYHEFVKQHPAYEDGTIAVYTTITLGMAALNDYDVLMITAGNYNEAGTVTLTGKTGVKIIGASTGMQWGEGSTCWLNTTSGEDIFDLTGNKGLEIAGIGFVAYNVAEKKCIDFIGLNYSTHIHHCSFIGNGGALDEGTHGIDTQGANGPDTYIHDCKFDRMKTVAIVMGHQRNVIKNNIFIVTNGGKGISHAGSTTAGFNIIADNYFLGNSTDGYGIYTAAITAGNFMIVNNRFVNFAATKAIAQVAGSDPTLIGNVEDGADGAPANIDPTA